MIELMAVMPYQRLLIKESIPVEKEERIETLMEKEEAKEEAYILAAV